MKMSHLSVRLYIALLPVADACAPVANLAKDTTAKAVVVLCGPIAQALPHQLYSWADKQLEDAVRRSRVRHDPWATVR